MWVEKENENMSEKMCAPTLPPLVQGFFSCLLLIRSREPTTSHQRIEGETQSKSPDQVH